MLIYYDNNKRWNDLNPDYSQPLVGTLKEAVTALNLAFYWLRFCLAAIHMQGEKNCVVNTKSVQICESIDTFDKVYILK